MKKRAVAVLLSLAVCIGTPGTYMAAWGAEELLTAGDEVTGHVGDGPYEEYQDPVQEVQEESAPAVEEITGTPALPETPEMPEEIPTVPAEIQEEAAPVPSVTPAGTEEETISGGDVLPAETPAPEITPSLTPAPDAMLTPTPQVSGVPELLADEDAAVESAGENGEKKILAKAASWTEEEGAFRLEKADRHLLYFRRRASADHDPGRRFQPYRVLSVGRGRLPGNRTARRKCRYTRICRH